MIDRAIDDKIKYHRDLAEHHLREVIRLCTAINQPPEPITVIIRGRKYTILFEVI